MFGTRQYERPIVTQAVDLNTGEVVIFDETTPIEQMPAMVLSTGSLPVAFEPIILAKQTLVDGGVFTNLDMSEAILKCKDMGYEEKDIIIDVILCFDKAIQLDEWTDWQAKWKNAYDYYTRRQHYREFYYYYEDITRVVRGYPGVHFRHLISPSSDLGGGYVPIFDGTDVTQQYL